MSFTVSWCPCRLSTGPEFNSRPGSLRDQMLKEPDSNSQSWRDHRTDQRDDNPEVPSFVCFVQHGTDNDYCIVSIHLYSTSCSAHQ